MHYRMKSAVGVLVFGLFVVSVGASTRQLLLFLNSTYTDRLQELWEGHSGSTTVTDDIYRNKYLLEEWKLNRTVPFKLSLILRNSFNHTLFRIFFSVSYATSMSDLTSVLNGSYVIPTQFTTITDEVDTMFGSSSIPLSIRSRNDSLKAYFAVVNTYNDTKLLFLKHEQIPFSVGNSVISTTYQYCVKYYTGYEAIVSRSSEELTSIDSCAWFCNDTSSFAVQSTSSMMICECVLGSTNIAQHIVDDTFCLPFTFKDENNDDKPCGMSQVMAVYSHDVTNFDSHSVMFSETEVNLADNDNSKTFTVEIGNGTSEDKIITGISISKINFAISSFTFEYSGESCSYNDSFQRYTEFNPQVFDASTIQMIEPLRTSCLRLTIYPSDTALPVQPRCLVVLYEPSEDYVTADRIGIYGYYHDSTVDTSGSTIETSQLVTSILPTSHIDTVALTTSQLGTSILPTSYIDTAVLSTSQLVTSILPTSHIYTDTVVASQGTTCTSSPTTVCSDDTTPTTEGITEPTRSQEKSNTLTCLSFCYHKYHKNLTREHVQDIRDEIRQFLLVDTKTLSSQIRKKISIRDRRPSATIIGTIPISILLSIIGCVVLSDLNIIRIHVYGMVKNIKGLLSFIRR
ncbi:uncharacterized protein LOC134726650 [Mytilus trossulus]|uniref:uncharacterized protein LOC134726650 n=1 Tax=Mytilus trossulus TaxID=6551 RepID=UPI0030063C54